MTAAATLTLAHAAGRTGRGVRIAVIDSGIQASHPHVLGIDSGVAVDDDGRIGADASDRLGHGTAVAAAIREKAPDAALVAIKVFDRQLLATGRALVAAIRFAVETRVTMINLSLGTTNPAHESDLAAAADAATRAGVVIIAAAPAPGARWLPGALPGVIGVAADFASARDACRIEVVDGRVRVAASGYARPIPGISPERNLRGASLAVANATGLLALSAEGAERVDAVGLARAAMALARA